MNGDTKPGDPTAPVITVDGPSGAGKGTLSQRLAGHLGWHLLDSGAIYRVLAFAAQRRGVPLDAADRLAALAERLDVTFTAGTPRDGVRVWLEGEDATAAIRTETAGGAASQVAAIPAVREALLQRPRAFRCLPGLIADGRDMGTVVFPDATLKLFLTASPRARAERRHKQLMEKGVDASIAALSEEIAQRDRRDRERSVAPLVAADDAILLDSTGKTIEAVWRETLAHLPTGPASA